MDRNPSQEGKRLKRLNLTVKEMQTETPYCRPKSDWPNSRNFDNCNARGTGPGRFGPLCQNHRPSKLAFRLCSVCVLKYLCKDADHRLMEALLMIVKGWKHLVMVQPLSRVRLLTSPWTAACQASLSFTVSRSLPRLRSVESLMLSNHFILCRSFSFCLQSFPAPGSFPMGWLFTSKSLYWY